MAEDFADRPASAQVGGRDVDVKRAVPGTNKLFVGGLPQNATAAELREHFEAFGVVSDAVVMIDPSTNRSRGFGSAWVRAFWVVPVSWVCLGGSYLKDVDCGDRP